MPDHEWVSRPLWASSSSLSLSSCPRCWCDWVASWLKLRCLPVQRIHETLVVVRIDFLRGFQKFVSDGFVETNDHHHSPWY